MSDTGEIIRTMRMSRNMTQGDLAEAVGVSRSTIAMWESNSRTPGIESFEALADIFNVPLASLIGRVDPKYPSNILPVKRKKIPLLGSIAAGIPIYADEDRDTYVLAAEDIRCDFALRVEGDSMEPRLRSGDIVFLRACDDVDDGEIAAVIIDDSATLKHVYHTHHGVTLASDNSKYAPMAYTRDNCEYIRVIGKAVAYQRDL